MKETKIEWCDSTWNPVTGCFHRCSYCYARGIAKRFGGASETTNNEFSGEECCWCTEADGTIHELNDPIEDPDRGKRKAPYPFEFDPTFHRYRLKQPKAWHEPRVIFVCSMADLFGAWVPDKWIEEVFAVCRNAPQHVYIFLTKNPYRYVELHNKGKLPIEGNMWYGASITDTFTLEQSRHYYAFLPEETNQLFSMEPLHDNIAGLAPCPEWREVIMGRYVKWVIIGAETGKSTKKVIPKKHWIDEIVEDCKEVHIPVFMKDSLVPVMGEENVKRQFPAALVVRLPINEATR